MDDELENITKKGGSFIDYYNNRRCNKYLVKLPSVDFSKRNQNGTCLIAIVTFNH